MNTLCCLLAALHAAVGNLPQSDFADTEVSTNIPFAISPERMNTVTLTLELDDSPSNSVEVALGHDADGDGNLSVGESALVFGYDCGKWFRRETKDDAVRPAASGRLTLLRNRDGLDPTWNLAKVTRRGLRPSNERVVLHASLVGTVIRVK